MRILMISAEGPPLQRSGAIIDALDALPRELRARGHEVSVVIPYYREIRESFDFETRDTGVTVDVAVGENSYIAEFLEGRITSGVQIFLVRCDTFFDREDIYGDPFEDNAARFIFFNRAAVELARRLTPSPDILHVHDWAAALVPVMVRAGGLPFSTVLTIHRIAEQGSFWGLDFSLTNLPQRYFTLHGLEYFGRMNFLKGGILFADSITTVSDHFRREMMRPEFGCGLDPVLRENSHKITGILDGADYTKWNPEIDKLLPATYRASDLAGKTECRDELLSVMDLAPVSDGPVFGMVTRLVAEKGLDLLVPLLDRLLSDDVRLIILGDGDPVFETALAVAARKYPRKFAYQNQHDERLAHLIEAGSDMTLIPSRIEPSGISAMHSLKYGALPIARATGGIHEIIEDHDPVLDTGYGFLCYVESADGFWDSIKRAREIFEDRGAWTGLMKRAMAREFSWESAAERYENVYRQTLHASGTLAA